jgi:hypothetical protein
MPLGVGTTTTSAQRLQKSHKENSRPRREQKDLGLAVEPSQGFSVMEIIQISNSDATFQVFGRPIAVRADKCHLEFFLIDSTEYILDRFKAVLRIFEVSIHDEKF